mmetsp:Transcript_2640/g.5567  ORF Transcript_2640/g.5567 Transcript_2640/m.5567 type:complete len:704 (-) Transcript_2640:111-2222(-)
MSEGEKAPVESEGAAVGAAVGAAEGASNEPTIGQEAKGFVRLRNSVWGSIVGKDEGRERWSSRIAFFFAAVGSAVGFGNVWRFPQLAADYGGGAFLIPYLIALFIIGIPILFLEISLGQFHQTGDVGVFGSINARLRGVGLSSVACAYMLVCYYTMLIAWVINAFFDSFTSNSPWNNEDLNGDDAVGYFFNDIIGMSTVWDSTDLRPTRLVWKNVGYAFLAWLIIYLCVAWGLKWTGRITYFTMGLPIVLLFVFLGTAVSLPGSEDGIQKYIGEWDMSVLVDSPDVWSRAVTQIFFSLSVTFGVMTAYGSHCKKTEPAFANSCVVACSNCLFSFISGFAVFAALGHLAYLNPDADWPTYESFGLVFGTWPVVLNTLPGGVHWVRLLFVDLFLLGLDSAFSLLEGVLTVVRDTVRFQDKSKFVVAGVACLTAWFVGWMYATDAGLFFLDVIDFYINFVMLLVGFFESFSVGWIYGIEKSIDVLGAPTVLSFMTGNFCSVILACGLWFGLKNGNAVWAGFVALILFYLACLGICLFFMSKKVKEEGSTWTWKSILFELYFRNMSDYKKELQPVVGRVPNTWCFLIRHIIPQILLICFINLARSDNEDGESLFGHYGGYATWPYQVLGIMCAAFALFLFLIGVAAPKTMAWLDLPEEKKIWKPYKKSDPDEKKPESDEENEAKNDNEKEFAAEEEPEADPADAFVE